MPDLSRVIALLTGAARHPRLLSARLRFIPTQAPYISECDWPECYRLETNQDGSLTMVFVTRGRFALKRWILG